MKKHDGQASKQKTAILENFLTELEKINKTKKLHLVDIFYKFGIHFFIFSKERFQNFKKLMKKCSKKSTKVWCTFSRSVHAHGHMHQPGPF